MMALFLAGSINLSAQTDDAREQQRKRDREEIGKAIKARKIAFITQEIDLTPEEAEKFWPVYNEFDKKRSEVAMDFIDDFDGRAVRGEIKKPKELSDEEAEKAMQDMFGKEQALLDLKKEYHEKFLKILPPSKVFQLYTSEHGFKRQLLGRMGEGSSREKYDAGQPQRRGSGGPDAKPFNRSECPRGR